MKQKKLFSHNSLLATITFLFGVMICQYTGNRGVFPIDSFSHFDSGYRILNGEHPFKDYWIVSGVFIDYLQSIIFYILGINWQTYLLNSSLLNGSVSLLVYFLFINLGLNFKLSFFYAICFSILAYPSSGTPFVDHHSALLSLIAIIMLIKAMKTNKLHSWFLVPVFMFFAFLSKQVPATYIFFAVIFMIVFHLTHQRKKDVIRILFTITFSSIILIALLILFFNYNNIDIKFFITQYIYYPLTIGEERYKIINYDFKNIFLNFKFIYFALLLLIFFTFKNFIITKNFYKNLNFKIFLICVLLTISLIQHVIVTKNQIFIFFLIPIILGFSHIQLKNSNTKIKKYINIILVICCVGITTKYHYRFNIDRKFHELNSVNFSEAATTANLSKKFAGLKWITPSNKNKKEAILELEFLVNVKNILKKDKTKKIVLTNYSLFSVILDENVAGYSRWYPGDNSGFPIKGNYYFENYKKFIATLLIDKQVSSIYILPDINEDNFVDYIDPKCFDKQILDFKIIKYKINKVC